MRSVTNRRAVVIGAVVLAAIAAIGLAAQGAAPAPDVSLGRTMPVDPAVRTGTLPNGLQYFIRHNGRPDKRVSLRLAVNAGAMQEEPDQRGLAHFIEHMAFNGSTHFKPGELVSFLESIGAQFGPHVNAYTSFDETVYMIDVPTDRDGYVDKGLLALQDFASGVSLLPDEVEKERGVVLEEWRGRLGAGSRITDKQLPVLLQGSRYAERLPIGLPDVITKAPLARIQAFYRTWYRPDLMAVVVVGDIAADEAEKLVRDHFGSIPAAASPLETIDRSVPKNAGTLMSVVTDPEAQGSTVSVVFKSDAVHDDTVKGYRDDLVRQLVSQMLSLRLREIARRPNAPFLGAQGGASSLGRTVQTFELEAATPEGQLTEGLSALMQEARRMAQYGFNQDELDRARQALMASYDRAYNERTTAENPGFASEYVRHFLEDEPIPGIEFEHAIAATYLPRVTTGDVSAVARSLITPDNRVVLAVAPEKKDAPAPDAGTLRAALARAESAPVERWADPTAGRDLVEHAPAPGRVVARREVASVGATVLTLSNGVEVWLKPTDFKADQVLFTSYAFGGLSLAAPSDYKTAGLATAMVGLAGVGGLSPVDLSKLLAGRIAQASASIGDYTEGISGSATPKDLETALKLAYLDMTAPNFTADGFDLLKRRLTGSLANRDQNPRAAFAEKAEEVNTSNHYSAQPMTLADVPALKLDVMKSFYQARFANAADFTYFFVGAFTVDGVTPLVEQWIGSLPSTGRKTAAFRDMGMAFPAANVSAEVKKGKEPASQTLMSFFADPGQDEFEMHRARSAASLLGIRLRDILREQLGGTYGVSVGFSNQLPLKGYGAMVIQFGSSPENVKTLVDASLAEIERLKKDGPSADDVAKVKELERRDIETNAKQNAYWLGSLQTVHMLGWDPASITRRPERTDRLTPEALHAMFRKYFPMDRYTVVTLDPEP